MHEIKIRIQEKIKNLSLSKKLDNKKILVFGYNIYSECINNFLHYEGYIIYKIIDNDRKKHGKLFLDIQIVAPESIDWKDNILVLIASHHVNDMTIQIRQLSEKTEIIKLFDFKEYKKIVTEREKFWLDTNYEKELKELNQGLIVYNRIKKDDPLIIFPLTALGDVFVGGLCFQEYMRKHKLKSIKVVVSSQGAYKVTQLFGIKKSEILTEQEMECLVKFIFFTGLQNTDIVCSWGGTFWFMTTYKRIPFSKYNAKFFFRLGNNYQMNFPSIWDKMLKDKDFINKGIIKGRTIILAPYANTIDNLPYQFWEYLAKRLLFMKYVLVTNIVGNQKPIKGSLGLEIPLNQIGSYLEYAGNFISIRSGLCDVIGHSKCRQVIIFRNQKWSFHTSLVETFDLHTDNISPNAVYCLYDDNDYTKCIDVVIESLKNKLDNK